MTESVMTATEASRGFSELLHRVCYGGESFVIKKGSRIMARITPVEAGVRNAEVQRAETSLPVIDDKMPENMTAEEAEFYQAWIEQIRKVSA